MVKGDQLRTLAKSPIIVTVWVLQPRVFAGVLNIQSCNPGPLNCLRPGWYWGCAVFRRKQCVMRFSQRTRLKLDVAPEVLLLFECIGCRQNTAKHRT